MSADDRAQIIAERDAQIIAWLGKKAAEYGTSNQESRAKAEAVSRMADKLSRGAVRDDETGVSELYRLRAENNQLRNDITGACLARYEEEQENERLLKERHSTNEALSDAAEQLCRDRDHIASLESDLGAAKARVAELETLLSDLSEPDADGTGRTYAEYHPSPHQQCGYDDYHDGHEWADKPHVWCPGHSYEIGDEVSA